MTVPKVAQHTPQIRVESATRNLEVLFDGKWVGLGVLGTTSWGIGLDTSRENQELVRETTMRYQVLVDECLRLLLAAPVLLARLEQLCQCDGCDHYTDQCELSSHQIAGRAAIAQVRSPEASP